MNISKDAVNAAELAAHDSAPMWRWGEMSGDEARKFFTEILEAAAPHLAAQALRDAVDAFPLETIHAPDTAVVWLMRQAEDIEDRLSE